MKLLGLYLVAIVMSCDPVFASQIPKELPQTVVVRINNSTKSIAVFHSQEYLPGNFESIKKVAGSIYIPVEINKPTRGELDRDTSRSSWFFNLGLNLSFGLRFGSGPGAYAPVYSYHNQMYPYYPYYYCNNYFPGYANGYPGYPYPPNMGTYYPPNNGGNYPPAPNYPQLPNGNAGQQQPPPPQLPDNGEKAPGPYNYFFYSLTKK